MLTYRLQYRDAAESEKIEADEVRCSDGVACFYTRTNRLLVVVPLQRIARIDIDWPETLASAYDTLAETGQQ